MNHAVHRYPRKRAADLRSEEKRERERREHDEQVFNDLWRTVPGKEQQPATTRPREERRRRCWNCRRRTSSISWRRSAPRLAPWQREVLRDRPHHRAVFLSAVADQGDERGLRDLHALHAS